MVVTTIVELSEATKFGQTCWYRKHFCQICSKFDYSVKILLLILFPQLLTIAKDLTCHVGGLASSMLENSPVALLCFGKIESFR